MVKVADFKFGTHVRTLPGNMRAKSDKLTKMHLNYYSVKHHFAEICIITSAF